MNVWVRRLWGVPLATANTIALVGLVSLMGGVAGALGGKWPILVEALVWVGAICVGYYLIHAIIDGAGLLEPPERRAVDARAVVGSARTRVTAPGGGVEAFRSLKELQELVGDLQAIGEHDLLMEVFKKLGKGLEWPVTQMRWRTARAFKQLRLSRMLDRTPQPRLHQELSRMFLSALDREGDRQVYREVADLLEEMTRWAFAHQKNLAVAVEVIQEFRQHELSQDASFPARQRLAFRALRHLSDKAALTRLVEMLQSDQPALREGAYLLAKGLVGRWVRRLPRRYFLNQLIAHPHALTDRLRAEMSAPP